MTTDFTPGAVPASIRFPPDIRSRAMEWAAKEDVSFNRFVVAAVAAAVDARENAPISGGEAARYEATVRFDLPAGENTDRRAYQVLDEVLNLAELSGATAVKGAVKRLADMAARTANWRR